MRKMLMMLLLPAILPFFAQGQVDSLKASTRRKETGKDADQANKEYETRLIFSPGIFIQGQVMGEVNLMLAKFFDSHSGFYLWGPRAGLEFNLRRDHLIYAPKIGYQLSFIFLLFRGNVLAYIDRGNVDLRLLPELGINLSRKANLAYGYGAKLLKYETPGITRNRVSLLLNIYSD